MKGVLALPHDSFDDLIRHYRQELLRYQSRKAVSADAPTQSAPPAEPPTATDAAPTVPSAPLPLLEELMQCRDGYTHSGTLQIAVTTARQALPLQDADVLVYCMQDGQRQLKYFLSTDESGRTPSVLLPAPPPVNSGAPGSPFPYALYGVAVYKPGFLPEREERVRIFADISGVVSFDLIPGDILPKSFAEGD